MFFEFQGSTFKNSACICKNDECLALRKQFQAVHDLRGHMFATPIIHVNKMTDSMKLKEFWCKRASRKLKINQIEIRSIDNRNRTKVAEKLRSRQDMLRREQKFISVLHFDPKVVEHIFKYDGKKYDFSLWCDPELLSNLGLYKKGEKLGYDDSDVYKDLGKICILPSYPIFSVKVDIVKCQETTAKNKVAMKTICHFIKNKTERLRSPESEDFHNDKKRRKSVETFSREVKTLQNESSHDNNNSTSLGTKITPQQTPIALWPKSNEITIGDYVTSPETLLSLLSRLVDEEMSSRKLFLPQKGMEQLNQYFLSNKHFQNICLILSHIWRVTDIMKLEGISCQQDCQLYLIPCDSSNLSSGTVSTCTNFYLSSKQLFMKTKIGTDASRKCYGCRIRKWRDDENKTRQEIRKKTRQGSACSTR